MNRLFTILLFLALTLKGFAMEYARFEENGKIGLKDDNGKIVLPAAFDALGWSDGNFSLIGQITGYRKDNLWGLLNLKKEFITKAEYQTLASAGGDRVIVSRLIKPFTIKFGCIDLQGKVMIPFAYDELRLQELRAIVMVKKGTRYEYGLVDLRGNGILPIQYKKIEPLGSLRFVVQDFTNKSALCSEDGKWITSFFIDHLSDFQFDLAVLRQEWKCGIIDRNGEIKIEPIYRELKITAPREVLVRKADEWKVINSREEEVQKIEADEIAFGSDGLNRIRMNNHWGLLNNDFNLRWAIDFDYLGPIENKLIVVKKNGKFSLLRMDQSEVLTASFDSLCVQNNFIRAFQKEIGKSSWALYDTFGIKKTLANYEFIDHFNGRFFPVKNRGYWGGVDRYGQEKIACVYDSLLGMKGDLMAVRFKDQYGVITLEDQWRLTPQSAKIELLSADCFLERKDSLWYLKDLTGNALYFTDNPIEVFFDHLQERLPDGTMKEINFQGQIVNRMKPVISPAGQQQFRESEGLIGIKRDGKFGFVDTRGRLRIANRYEAISEFHEGLTAVKLLGKWGFINAADQIVIQPTYEKVGNFENSVAQVTRNGKSGLIGREGNVLLELRYDSIEKLPGQLMLLTLGTLHGLADPKGRVLIEPRFEFLQVLPNHQVIVKQNNRYGLLTIDGMSIFPIQYNSLVYWTDTNEFLIHSKSEWTEIKIK